MALEIKLTDYIFFVKCIKYFQTWLIFGLLIFRKKTIEKHFFFSYPKIIQQLISVSTLVSKLLQMKFRNKSRNTNQLLNNFCFGRNHAICGERRLNKEIYNFLEILARIVLTTTRVLCQLFIDTSQNFPVLKTQCLYREK